MPVQSIRRANLHKIVQQLEHAGFGSRELQVLYLGRPVSARKLQAMLDGARIESMFAEHVEFVMERPRGWLSHAHEATEDEEVLTPGLAAKVTTGPITK